MRWSLSAMLLAITIIAASFGLYRAAWADDHPNHSLLLGAFILSVCVAVVAAFQTGSRFRSAFAGAALFGGVYLVCVLHGGFGLKYIQDSQFLARNTLIGFALLVLAFLATQLCIMLQRPVQAAEQRRPDEPSAD